jgi:hypothetical protein
MNKKKQPKIWCFKIHNNKSCLTGSTPETVSGRKYYWRRVFRRREGGRSWKLSEWLVRWHFDNEWKEQFNRFPVFASANTQWIKLCWRWWCQPHKFFRKLCLKLWKFACGTTARTNARSYGTFVSWFGTTCCDDGSIAVAAVREIFTF